MRRPIPLLITIAVTVCGFTTLIANAATAGDDRETGLIATLQSNSTPQQKVNACRELQAIATPASIPALAHLLTDPELSLMARYALEPLPGPEAGQALLEALGQTEGLVKIGIIGSLGARREEAAVPQLIQLLTDADQSVIKAAAQALGRIGTPQAAQALKSLRTASSEPLRRVAAEASLIAAEQLLDHGNTQAANEIYAQLLAPSWPPPVRAGAFSGQLKTQPQSAVNHIVQALGSSDLTLRSIAVTNTPNQKDRGIVGRLIIELPKLPAEIQVVLIGALADCDDETAQPALIQALTHPDGTVRMAAVQALARIGNAACVGPLCQTIANGKSAEERQTALTCLEGLRGAGVNQALLASLKEAPVSVQPTLIDTLTLRGATESVPYLMQETGGANPRVRTAAFKALGQLGGDREFPALLTILVNLVNENLRDEAERAVVQLARKATDQTARTNEIIAALAQSTTTPAQCSLLRVLGNLANDKALDAVRKCMHDKTPEVRETALRSLAAWPNSQALDPLLAELDQTADPTHRVVLLRGCVRLLNLDDRPAGAKIEVYRELTKTAQRADDKKLLLGGLTSVTDPGALELATTYLKDTEVKTEAELAVVKIAGEIAPAAPAPARLAVERVLAESNNEAIRAQAAALIQKIDQFDDYIMVWQVAGPYTNNGATAEQLYQSAFPPEKCVPSVNWQRLQAGSLAGKPVMIDLSGRLGAGQGAAYARTWIHCDQAQSARLEMGADDELVVWLDEKRVYANPVPGPAIPGEDQVSIDLKAGWSLLTVKIVQHSGPWEFCARLRTPDGAPLAGVSTATDHNGPAIVLESPAAPAAAPFPPIVPIPADHWQPLFNGKDLTGWHATGSAIFKVEEGLLIGTQTTGQGGDLWTETQWDDFELQITYRVVWPANTGFWFRYDGEKGYQFDVLKYTNPVAFSGSLYCPGKLFITSNLNEALENRDGWNEARVRAQGDVLTIWLNGAMTGQCRDSTLRKGTIGIQVHPGDEFKGMQVIVKDIRITPLPPADAP